MKIKHWSVCFMLISASLLAEEAVPHSPYSSQDPNTMSASNAPAEAVQTPPASPAVTPPVAEATNPAAAPVLQRKAAAPGPKRAGAKRAAELKTTPLLPGPAVVAANRVNVRGQARLNSEILTRMTNGELVTVMEEIKLQRSGPEEPSVWARIALPQKARVWVHASFIDPTNKTVLPKKLNIRGGPGENYSVLGSLQRGDAVKEIQTKGHWVEIEATTNAYGFMAAQYLTQESQALASFAPTEAATVPETPSVAQADINAPVIPEGMMETNQLALASTNEPMVAPAIDEPPPPRIVQREGIVRYTASIQAPTMFQLVSPENHKPIDYLYTTSPNLDLNRYKGLHIIVTGEEGLDERWKNTPVITIQRIEVIE